MGGGVYLYSFRCTHCKSSVLVDYKFFGSKSKSTRPVRQIVESNTEIRSMN